MRKYFASGCIAVVALTSALGFTGCCCQRKGLVLRGDWSLELNRVPHMRSNGPTYGGDGCAEPCDDYSCTSGGCSDGSCIGCRGDGGAGGIHGGRLPGGRAGGGYYESGPGGAGGSGAPDGEPHLPSPPQPTPAAQSRFHPVPTRPVFEPQNSVATVPYDAAANTGANAGGAASSRRPTEERRAPARQTEPTSAPRSNRVATRMPAPPIPQRELEPALFVEPEGAGEVQQATNDEVVATAEESADEHSELHATPASSASSSAWRVKARRS